MATGQKNKITMKTRLMYSGIVIVGATLFPLLVIELTLHLFPVSSATSAMELNDQNPILRYQPNQSYIFSKGWQFEIVNTGRINNYGFVNDQDYVKHAADGPVIVLGDSYIEAMMIPYEHTIQGRLSRLLAPNRLVYSLGQSGAQLADYLSYAQYASNEFHPCAMVFVVVGNDFDESLAKYRRGPGYHFEQTGSTSDLQMVRTDYHPSLWKRIIRHSILVRYLWKTIGIGHISDTLSKREGNAVQYAGNTTSTVSQERLTESQGAVDYFLQELSHQAGISKSRILFVVDGVRPELYSESDERNSRSSYFDIMRRYFLVEATRLGYEAIDMEPRFVARHQRDGARFEFRIDGHWNDIGHQEATEAIVSSRMFYEIMTQ